MRRRFGIAVLAAGGLLLSGCGSGSDPSGVPSPDAPDPGPTSLVNDNEAVTLSVTASPSFGASTITYAVNDNAIQQATDRATPWTHQLGCDAPSCTLPITFLDLSAQNADGSSGASITCTISQDGTVLTSNTAQGPYAIAECKLS